MPSDIEDHIADTYDAARAYVAARLANEAAEPGDMLASIVRVDAAYDRLVEVSGLSLGVEGAK